MRSRPACVCFAAWLWAARGSLGPSGSAGRIPKGVGDAQGDALWAAAAAADPLLHAAAADGADGSGAAQPQPPGRRGSAPLRRRLHAEESASDDETENPDLAAGSELIWSGNPNLSLSIVVAIGLLLPCCSIVSSRLVAKQLWLDGAAATGTDAIDTTTMQALSLLASVPKLAVVGMLGVAMPELIPVWLFLGSLITSLNFLRVPDYLFELSGGRMAIMLQLSKADDDDRAPVKVYPCGKQRRPTIGDLKRARVLILQFVFLFPAFCFCQLIFEYQFALGASFAEDALGVLGTFNILKLPCAVACMTGCRALFAIIGYASAGQQEPASGDQVKWFFRYCQSYILCVNALPSIVRLILIFEVDLENGEYMPSESVSNLGCALALCIGTALSSRVARRAFVADAGALQHGAGLQLQALRFCPFCGHGGLELEAKHRRGFCGEVFCGQCGAAGLPDHLCARREPGLGPGGRKAAALACASFPPTHQNQSNAHLPQCDSAGDEQSTRDRKSVV